MALSVPVSFATVLQQKTEKEKVKTLYACPMHPEVTGQSTGKCSKCGMALKPKKEKKKS